MQAQAADLQQVAPASVNDPSLPPPRRRSSATWRRAARKAPIAAQEVAIQAKALLALLPKDAPAQTAAA